MMRLATIAILAAACSTDAPQPAPSARTFFDRNVFPVLELTCASSGCHGSNTSDPTLPLGFIGDRDSTYAASVTYAGNFDDTALLLTAHPNMAVLSPNARDVFEQWFAAERAERGL